MSHSDLHHARPTKRRRLSPTSSPNESDTDEINGLERTIGLSSAEDEEEEEHDDPASDHHDYSNNDDAAGGMEVHPEKDFEEDQDGGVPTINVSPAPATGQGPNGRLPASTHPARSVSLPQTITAARPTGSSPFKVEVDEMLLRVKPDYDRIQLKTNDYLKKLKSVIEAIPDCDPLPPAEAERKLLKSHKIAIPFSSVRPPNDAKYKFSYAKPSSVNVVGSYALQTATKQDGDLTIDLIVHMPDLLFEAKDYLNNRYLQKRAYYLACVAAGVQKSAEYDAELKFSLLADNPLLPVLVMRSSNITSQTDGLRVNIMPAVSADIFPSDKTRPDRNCVRTASTTEQNSNSQPPTPFYNASLRSDCSVNGFLKLTHTAAARCPGFRDACVLGSIWLQQRGLTSSIAEGGFGRFEWSAIMALLFETGAAKGRPLLSESYNSVQLFGATLHFLAQRDLVKSPLVTDGRIITSHDSTPMLFDSKRDINVLYKMTTSSYRLLKREAQATSKIFGSSNASKFESLFITKVSQPLLRYDLIFKFESEKGSLYEGPSSQSVYETVSHGLGDRISTVHMWSSTTPPWSINVSEPQRKSTMYIGVILDPANAGRSVDRGPSAEDEKGTASFRDFWGEKAELRRFKDGQIRESVVWSTNDSIVVTSEIVLFLLRRHSGLRSDDDCQVVGNSFKNVPGIAQTQTVQTQHQQATAAFQTLESELRGLENLPLQIRQIQPSGGALRSTHIPSTSTSPSSISDITLQFEASSRWPTDLPAIQMTKTAFLLKLASLLDSSPSQKITSARIGLENSNSPLLNKAFLEISLPSPSSGSSPLQQTGVQTFRLRIHHDREPTLLTSLLSNKSTPPPDRDAAAKALASYKRTYLHAPLHTQTVQKLSTQFPAYAPTVRLLKSWFSAQLLGNHFRHELVDLLAAKVFVETGAWGVPSSPGTGFLRTLAWLARWDWQVDPLVLDTSSGGMKKADVEAIRVKFEAWRSIDPALNRVVLFVASNYDGDGITWTEYTPGKVVAARMSGLAQAADRVVRTKGLELNLGDLFKPSLGEYDFLIRMASGKKPKKGRSGGEGGKKGFKNLQNEEDPSMAGFNPTALYLEELERIYGDAIVFFHDTLEERVIAGLWMPHTERRRWKVNLGWSTRLLPREEEEVEEESRDADATINKSAMLAEMARLGGDLVRSIEQRSA